MNIQFIGLIILLATSVCRAQNTNMMNNDKNPLLCDPKTGVCEIPDTNSGEQQYGVKSELKPVKIIYFTDPICSSCWGIEPQLRRLKLEYGHEIEFEYRMGGLLPDWSYNSGGISKPSDVAHHWDEVSEYYQMPIDGDVWLEDPLNSSYPPSIAFKAAQLQDNRKAVEFMRVLREMVFLKKMNITKWENIEQAAKEVGLDVIQLKSDYEGRANKLFDEDLKLGKQMGVRGFPTLFVTDSSGVSRTVYGFKKYDAFESEIQKVNPAVQKTVYAKDWKSIFAVYPTLTLREFAELCDKSIPESEKELNLLVEQNQLSRLDTKNGSLWILLQK